MLDIYELLCVILSVSDLFIEEGYVKMFLRGRPVTMYMPKDQVESYNLEAKAELPAKRLKLEWVYPFLFKKKCSHAKLEVVYSFQLFR